MLLDKKAELAVNPALDKLLAVAPPFGETTADVPPDFIKLRFCI